MADQPPLAVAQAPSLCRLCDVELRGQTWRAHVKSDEHVHKLQAKVAEPAGVAPPLPRRQAAGRDQAGSTASSSARDEAEASEDDDDAGDNDDDASAPGFVPGKCLFCVHESAAGALDDSLAHMATAHGFSVPFQDCLAVSVETVVAYLRFVIHGYRECICCGTRRSTVEGARQHMVDKGHCRFDISPDTEDFYEMPQSENSIVQQAQRDSSEPVRLPSGKLVSHRRNLDARDVEARAARRATPERCLPASTPRQAGSSSAPGVEVARRRGGDEDGQVAHVTRSEALLAARLSKLVVAGTRMQQKEEQRKRGRLESANNSILQTHFRHDAGDGRLSRKFCA